MRKFSIISFCLIFFFSLNPILSQNNLWYSFPSGTPEAANRFIYVDDTDVKWIGGYNGGMHKYNNGIWTNYTTGVANTDVRQSCFDTLGNIWMATWHQLSKFNPTTSTWTSFNVTGQSLDILNSVQVDNQNRVWVGTDGGADPDDGLYMYDGTTWTFYDPTNSNLPGRYIPQLKKDLTGKIWGVSTGLFEINGTVISNHSLQIAGFPVASFATSIDFDSYNNKWVGVYGGGIGKFDGNNWTIYTPSNSPIPENKVWSISVDQNNVVWIGTETKGLVKFDGINWTIYNTSNSVITNDRIDALAVDKLNNLWIAPNYGGIIVHNTQGLSGIKGYLYYDQNNNNAKDSNEPFLPNQIVKIGNTGLNAITNAQGTYHCPILNTGTYYAKVVKNSPHISSVSPDSISITINNTAALQVNKNFGIKLQSNIHDLAIDYTSEVAPRPGFGYYANLTVKNIGSLQSDSIRLKLLYDSNLLLDSVSRPFALHQSDSIIWNIDSLKIFDQVSIKLYFHLAANVNLLGTTLNNYVTVKDNSADFNFSDNTSYSSDLIVGAYDPNDKKAIPEGSGAFGNIPPNTANLIYTIRFQNTGSAAAENIIIKDTIQSNLDLSSIQMISSSHDYSSTIKNGGIVWWTFNNINLPDSNQNEPASHGYIKYKINLKPNLSVGTQIKNTGYIYFDFNPPIVTNTALNTIYNVSTDINNYFSSSDISIYPNPTKENLTINLNSIVADEHYSITIINALGKSVYEDKNLTSKTHEISVRELANGIYFIKIETDNQILNQKFIKT